MKEGFCSQIFNETESENFKKLSKPVKDVMTIWQTGGNHMVSKHGLDQANIWDRKPWCSCQPYTGSIMDDGIGWENEHIDIFDVDSEDSDYDEQKDGKKKFAKVDRDFQGWFKEVSGRS
jgi:hypothetical protein